MDLLQRERIVEAAQRLESERYGGQSTTVGKASKPKLSDIISRIRHPIQQAANGQPSDRDKSQLLKAVSIADPATGEFDAQGLLVDLGAVSRNASSNLYALTANEQPCVTEKGFQFAAKELDVRIIDKLNMEFERTLDNITETERTTETKARVGQQILKEELLKAERTCQVTSLQIPPLLRASHIRPWKDPNKRDRLNPRNALLLAVNVDACFDRLLISFDSDGRILISPELSPDDHRRLGITPEMTLRNHGKHQEFLAEHRQRFAAAIHSVASACM